MVIEAKQRLISDANTQKEAVGKQIKQKQDYIKTLRYSIKDKEGAAKIPVEKTINRVQQDILNLKQRREQYV